MRYPALASTVGSISLEFRPPTTMTRSVLAVSKRIALPRKVPRRQGSRALGRPMRDESPAARMTPQKLGARPMVRD